MTHACPHDRRCLTDRVLARCRLTVDIVDSINAEYAKRGDMMNRASAGRERALVRRLEARQAASVEEACRC